MPARALARLVRIAILAVLALGIVATPSHAANVTVSGLAIETITDAGDGWNSCNGSTNNVRLVLDANTFTQSVPCDAVTGAYTFTNVPLSATHTITIYLLGSGTEQGVTYVRNANTTSNITNVLVSEDWIRMRSLSGAMTNALVNTWDNSNDPLIPAASTGAVLTTTATQRLGVVVDNSTFQPGGDVTVDKVLLDGGTWTSGAETLVLTGTGFQSCSSDQTVAAIQPLCKRGTSTFTAGTGTVRFTLQNASNHTDLDGPFTFNNLQVHPAASGKDICIVNSGTIAVATADFGNGTGVVINNWGLLSATNGAGTIALNAGASFEGSGNVEARGNFTGAGTLNSSFDVTMRPNGGSVLIGSTSGAANWLVNDFISETAGGAATVRTASGGTGALQVGDDIIVGNPTDAATTTLDLDTNDRQVNTQWFYVTTRGHVEMSGSLTLPVARYAQIRQTIDSNGGTLTVGEDLDLETGSVSTMLASTVTVGGDFWIAPGATYTVAGAGNLVVDGDFIKEGTFTPGTGTVELADAALPSYIWHSSPTTFYNLRNVTPNKVVRVDKDFPITVTNLFTLTGTSCTARAALASSADGTVFSMAAATVSANFADIGDSNQTSGARIATNSWNHGGNTNWTFNTPCASHTVSGFALQSEGGAGWSQCNGTTPNISLSVNGFSPVSVPCTAGTGAFTIPTSVEPDTAMIIFLDPTSPGDQGAVVTRGVSPAANMSGLTIVKGQARIRSETASAVNNVDLNRYDDVFDGDVPITVADNTLAADFDPGIEAVIEAGDTYQPGAQTTSEAFDISGTLGNVGVGNFDLNVTGLGTTESCTAAHGTSVPLCIRAGGSLAMDPGNWVVYRGNGNVNVWATTYPNLALDAGSGNRTYQLGTSAVNNTVTSLDQVYVDGNNTASTTSFNSNLVVQNDLDVAGTLSGAGTGTVTVWDNLEGAGTIDFTAGTFLMENHGSTDMEFCAAAGATYHFWDFTMGNTTASTKTLTSMASCTFHVRRDLNVGRTGDTNISRIDMNNADPSVDVDRDVNITTRGDLRASNSSPFLIARNFTNDGTFTHNSGTVTFDTTGTTSAINHSVATTFNNLSVLVEPKQLNFPAGRTTTIAGTMTITGTSCLAPVHIRSTVPGSQYTLNIGTVATTWATIMDSVASPARTAPLTGDLGNNSGWTFSGGCTPGANAMYANDSNAQAGATNEPDIASDTFHMSWMNASGMAFDQQQARVITTPLTNVVALWQFDTATGATADTSGNGYTLSPQNAPTSPAGQTGFSEAIGLNGTTQYTTSAATSAFDLGNNFTVEAWFRRTGSPATDEAIVERGSSLNRTFLIYIGGGSNQVAAITSRGGSDYWVGGGTQNVTDGAWHHVALTVDSSNVERLYVDGVQQGAGVSIGGAVTGGAGQAVRIGRYGNSSAAFFTGQIDDVRISNVARTAGELNGYAKLRDAHNKTLWTSAVLPVTCNTATRCADIVYAGPALRRPDARYYAQARGRLAPWVAFSA